MICVYYVSDNRIFSKCLCSVLRCSFVTTRSMHWFDKRMNTSGALIDVHLSTASSVCMVHERYKVKTNWPLAFPRLAMAVFRSNNHMQGEERTWSNSIGIFVWIYEALSCSLWMCACSVCVCGRVWRRFEGMETTVNKQRQILVSNTISNDKSIGSMHSCVIDCLRSIMVQNAVIFLQALGSIPAERKLSKSRCRGLLVVRCYGLRKGLVKKPWFTKILVKP